MTARLSTLPMLPVLLFLVLGAALVQGIPAPRTLPPANHVVDQSFHHHLIRRAVESNKITKITAGQFQIDFHCESTKPGFCDKAAEAAKRACNRIQAAIKLRQPVNMVFTLFKPCNQDNPTPETCSMSQVVGLAAPLHSFPVRHKDDNQTYMYPTVLLKQTDLVPQGLAVAWPKYDVLSAFNELAKYTFEDPNGGPEFNDMEYVATHEITHGLGLGITSSASVSPAGNTSLLAPSHNLYPAGAPPGEITLPIDFDSNGAGDLRMYRLAHPNIFERFVTFTRRDGSRTPLPAIAQQMQQVVDRIIQAGTLVKPLSEEAQRNASKALDLTDAMRAVVAKAGPAYFPADVYHALAADAAASAVMAELMALATTKDTFDFDPTRWAPAAAQLTALRLSRDGFKLETSLKPFTRGSSLGHVQFPASLIQLAEENKRKREEEQRRGNNTQVPTDTATASGPIPTATAVSAVAALPEDDESVVLTESDESHYYHPQLFAYFASSGSDGSDAKPAVSNDGNKTLPPIPTDLGPNFIMHASVLPWPLEDMIKQTKAPASGIGPGLLSALVAMGYTPVSASEFVSRKEMAELVREEIPLATKT